MPKVSVTALAAKVDEIEEKVEDHDRFLIRGEGPNQAPIPERVRNLETKWNEAAFWLRSIAILFLGQFAAVLTSMLYFFVKILPALLKLDSGQNYLGYLVHFFGGR